MATYLLTWNPGKFGWRDFPEYLRKIKRDGTVRFTWSCGRNTRLRRGDRVFLLRQGNVARGLIGSGTVVSNQPEPGLHWDDRESGHQRTTMYVEVEWDVLRPDPLIPRSALDDARFGGVYWNTQISGIGIPPQAAQALEELWARSVEGEARLPEEVDGETYPEGGLRRITVNAYERNPRARRECLDHYGPTCVACGTDMAALYGPKAAGLIHIHHTTPVSRLGADYQVDPIADLRPVCPNCHAVIHHRREPYSIEEVAQMYQAASMSRSRT